MKPQDQAAVEAKLNGSVATAVKQFRERVNAYPDLPPFKREMRNYSFDGSTYSGWLMVSDIQSANYILTVDGKVLVQRGKVVKELQEYYKVFGLRAYDYVTAVTALDALTQRVEAHTETVPVYVPKKPRGRLYA